MKKKIIFFLCACLLVQSVLFVIVFRVSSSVTFTGLLTEGSQPVSLVGEGKTKTEDITWPPGDTNF